MSGLPRPVPSRGRFRRQGFRGDDDPWLVDIGFELRLRGDGAPPEIHVEPADWTRVFGADRPLRVEVGFGKSDFLVRLAASEPDFHYVGFEYSSERAGAFLRKVHAAQLDNIRVVCCNAADILDRIFAPESLDRVFVLFPDPWPKRRHARHRFVRSENIARLLPLLRPGGGLTLRTDDEVYARQMLQVLESEAELINSSGPGAFAAAPRDPFPTLYERKFLAMGRRIHYLEYRKRDATGPAAASPPEPRALPDA